MGSKEGGIKTRDHLYDTYGADYYRNLGVLGGKQSHSGGFRDPEVAKRAGRSGGLKRKGFRQDGTRTEEYSQSYLRSKRYREKYSETVMVDAKQAQARGVVDTGGTISPGFLVEVRKDDWESHE